MAQSGHGRRQRSTSALRCGFSRSRQHIEQSVLPVSREGKTAPVIPAGAGFILREDKRAALARPPPQLYMGRAGDLLQDPAHSLGTADRSQNLGVAMTEHTVMIVGGGPTGLMLAGELALAGVGAARRLFEWQRGCVRHEK